jgi:hypothetical protein
MFWRAISTLFFASMLLPLAASSQTQTTGRITGTVVDAQGAVIVGAEVSVENLAAGDRRTVLTDNSGTYSVFQLPPATYVVSMRAPGFSLSPSHFQPRA